MVDDEACVRSGLVRLLEALGYDVQAHADGDSFLREVVLVEHSCVLLDACLVGMGGLDVLAALSNRRCDIPVIFMSGHCDFSMCVRAMKAGAVDFLLKPLCKDDILAAVTSAHLVSLNRKRAREESGRAAELLRRLTVRERQVLALVLEGRRNKQIAAALESQEATVKVHRSRLMRKLGVRSLPDLVRIGDRGDLATMLDRDRDVAAGVRMQETRTSARSGFVASDRRTLHADRSSDGDGWLAAEGNWLAFTWRMPTR